MAIHLDRQETFAFNKETQLFPIAGLVAAELNRTADSTATGEKTAANNETEKGDFAPLKSVTERHHPYLVELIAAEAGVKPDDILDLR